MKIYNYHPNYKTLVCSSEADPSPLEPGAFLIPAHATVIEPISCQDCEIPIFKDDHWEVIKNHMGIYYDKQYKTPFEWYDPINPPKNGTKTSPPEVKDGFLVLWENEDWNIIESKVGTYYYIPSGQKFINEDPFNEPENVTKEQPPEVPEGYALKWSDGWTTKEIPPVPELTPQQILKQAGLTVEELKELLGL